MKAEEEADEKANPGVNSLFQKIYEDGSDEVKKAMIKSFVNLYFCPIF